MDIEKLRRDHSKHWKKACAIRTLTLDAVAAANSGHSGAPIGMADVATILFEKHLKFDSQNPDWLDRDRFILSAGHASMLLYSLLYLTGYKDVSLEEIKNFRQWGSKTAGHPEYGHAKGIETTTGPLGQGLASSVGFAMAEELLRAQYGTNIFNHHTYVLAGDGCLMEGISQEAISLAGRQQLSKLIVLWDNNNITIDGTLDLSDKTNQLMRFRASGWDVFEIDGHNPIEIDQALTIAKKSKLPTMISSKTNIALGTSAQDTSKGHGALTDKDLISEARSNYGWNHSSFEIPTEIKTEWENIGKKGSSAFKIWENNVKLLTNKKQIELKRIFDRDLPATLSRKLNRLKRDICDQQPTIATRKSSELTLEVINPLMKETFGGSADLTGSNNTKTKDLGVFSPENRSGRYVYYGIREHAMAAAMNGMANHGGVRPYSGTFMCFTDYARPAMRLSALMEIPVVYVMTHDSIGLGEDGPTHQPIEHLAISRSTPNTNVFRPADTIETAESWEIALGEKTTPSILSLTRQNVPTLRTSYTSKNLTSFGAYILHEASIKRRAILIATGSEVQIAQEARILLENEGIGTRVVSMPCWELFEQQSEKYKKRVLPAGPVRVAIEAGASMGWDRWLSGERGSYKKSLFIGMNGFGASAPSEILYEKFQITAENAVNAVRKLLKID